jgi:hypothetical protein
LKYTDCFIYLHDFPSSTLKGKEDGTILRDTSTVEKTGDKSMPGLISLIRPCRMPDFEIDGVHIDFTGMVLTSTSHDGLLVISYD